MDSAPLLDYRAMTDMILWAVLLAVLLVFLWALAVGPVSRIDPAPTTAPIPAEKRPAHLGSGAPVA